MECFLSQYDSIHTIKQNLSKVVYMIMSTYIHAQGQSLKSKGIGMKGQKCKRKKGIKNNSDFAINVPCIFIKEQSAPPAII
jgi:hypothetical protein